MAVKFQTLEASQVMTEDEVSRYLDEAKRSVGSNLSKGDKFKLEFTGSGSAKKAKIEICRQPWQQINTQTKEIVNSGDYPVLKIKAANYTYADGSHPDADILVPLSNFASRESFGNDINGNKRRLTGMCNAKSSYKQILAKIKEQPEGKEFVVETLEYPINSNDGFNTTTRTLTTILAAS